MSRILGTYALKYPIVRETRGEGGDVHEEELKPAGFLVTVKRPRGREMRIMDRYEGQEIAGSLALLAKISNLDEEEVDLLDGDDIGELGNLLSPKKPDGLETGGTA